MQQISYRKARLGGATVSEPHQSAVLKGGRQCRRHLRPFASRIEKPQDPRREFCAAHWPVAALHSTFDEHIDLEPIVVVLGRDQNLARLGNVQFTPLASFQD